MLSCFSVPPPVALTGNKIGQEMQHPTKQIMMESLMYRRRK
jgi:hypothetical protein